jgi:hypothetical protein
VAFGTVSHLWSGEFRFQFVLVEPCCVLRIGDLLHSQVCRTPPRAWVGDLHHFQVHSYPVLRAGDLEVLLSVDLLPEQCLSIPLEEVDYGLPGKPERARYHLP